MLNANFHGCENSVYVARGDVTDPKYKAIDPPIPATASKAKITAPTDTPTPAAIKQL